nr:reverse transcriptase domain-containing protein [Tanacetum cinerariifolium]
MMKNTLIVIVLLYIILFGNDYGYEACKEDGEDDIGSSMEVKVLPKKGGYGVSIKMDMTYPFLQFLEILPEEKRKARANRRKAEAKPAAAITGAQVKKFVWDNKVCKFGLPSEIISKNGKQFRDNPFKDWCEKLCIRQCFSFVKHPQANGLVKRANRSLSEGIKAWLDVRRKNWLEEISHVLWAHRTMIKSSNGETPFSLTHGAEVVIPVEIGMPTLRTAEVDMIKNNESVGVNLDILEEKDRAAIQEAKIKAKMKKYYNARVRSTSFRLRDLIYRNNKAIRAKDRGKLGPKWKGPYEVTESMGKGAYKLRDSNENTLPRTWNVCNLKKCYMHEM